MILAAYTSAWVCLLWVLVSATFGMWRQSFWAGMWMGTFLVLFLTLVIITVQQLKGLP